jgi:MFS family permease
MAFRENNNAHEPSPTMEKRPQTIEQLHFEDVVRHDEDDDFAWSYDVITNLLALYLTYFASTWAMGVPGGSIAYIMAEYPTVSVTTTAWVATAPSVALCVISIFLGDVSDIFGRRWFLIAAAIFGLAGALIGSRASSVNMLIGGQVLNGIALTIGYLSTPLLAEVVPKRWRPPIVGGGTVLVGLSGIAGGISQ